MPGKGSNGNKYQKLDRQSMCFEINTDHFILNKSSTKDNIEEINQLPQKPSIYIPNYNGFLFGTEELTFFIQKEAISESLLSL